MTTGVDTIHLGTVNSKNQIIKNNPFRNIRNKILTRNPYSQEASFPLDWCSGCRKTLLLIAKNL